MWFPVIHVRQVLKKEKKKNVNRFRSHRCPLELEFFDRRPGIRFLRNFGRWALIDLEIVCLYIFHNWSSKLF